MITQSKDNTKLLHSFEFFLILFCMFSEAAITDSNIIKTASVVSNVPPLDYMK